MAILLFAGMIGLVAFAVWRGSTIEQATALGITPFVGLLTLVYNAYFKAKEAKT